MKPEVNALLAEVKAQMNSMDNAIPQPQPATPDFSTMSIMEATKWCLVEGGIDKPSEIAKLTGKSNNAVYTALWKIRNPKRVKVLYRRAKKIKALKAGIVKEGVKDTKPTKVKKPKIENGLYEDGMETPYRDALQRQGVFPEFVKPKSLELATEWLGETKTTTIHNELMAENRRLKILVEHYESLLFKGGK
jgi:hypothetical protein